MGVIYQAPVFLAFENNIYNGGGVFASNGGGGAVLIHSERVCHKKNISK